MNETYLLQQIVKAIKALYHQDILIKNIQISKTRKDFSGDYTLVVFPLLSISKKSPEATANDIGEYLKANYSALKSFNIVKGFLNLSFTSEFWIEKLKTFSALNENLSSTNNKILIEFSSPNTNKPLHLGHIRNNLIGHSISEILKKVGNEVVRVNLINDRGIHICKSMLAWQKWGNGETPESSGLKGDHLIGKYYILFDVELKKEIAVLVSKGNDEETARSKASLMIEAQEMLRKWEGSDSETITLWKKMNSWVYDGFEKTYNALGITFDKLYYESDTYLLGKCVVGEGLDNEVLVKKPDNSIWINLTD
ncbi:MAG: arginine--tRNA ligase, partial [Bacteroidetes bacterium GWA2_30_7]